MTDLRSKVIRLAYARPDLRASLLPLVVGTPPRVAKHQDHSLAASKLFNAIVGEVKRSRAIKEAIRDLAQNVAEETNGEDLVDHHGEVSYPSVKADYLLWLIEDDKGWDSFGRSRTDLIKNVKDLKIGPSQDIPFIKFSRVDPKVNDLIVAYSQLKDRDIYLLEQTLGDYYGHSIEDFDSSEFEDIYDATLEEYGRDQEAEADLYGYSSRRRRFYDD